MKYILLSLLVLTGCTDKSNSCNVDIGNEPIFGDHFIVLRGFYKGSRGHVKSIIDKKNSTLNCVKNEYYVYLENNYESMLTYICSEDLKKDE